MPKTRKFWIGWYVKQNILDTNKKYTVDIEFDRKYADVELNDKDQDTEINQFADNEDTDNIDNVDEVEFSNDENEMSENNSAAQNDILEDIKVLKGKEVDQLKHKLSKLEGVIQKKDEELNKYKIENKSLKNEISTLASENETKHNIIEEFNRNGKAVTDEMNKHLTQIKSLNDNIAKLQKKNLQLKEQKTIDGNELQKQQREIEMLKKDVYKLETSNNAKTKKIDTITEELTKIKEAYKKTKKDKTVHNADKDKELNKLLEERRRLLKSNDEIFKMFKKQMELVDLLKKKITHLESVGT